MKSSLWKQTKNIIVLGQENFLIKEEYHTTAVLLKSIIYFLYSFSNCLISSLNSLPLSFNLLFFLIIGIIHQACRPIKTKIKRIKSGVPGDITIYCGYLFIDNNNKKFFFNIKNQLDNSMPHLDQYEVPFPYKLLLL